MRLLFVDDEPRVLDGIKRSLFSIDDWDADFATSGAAGLACLAEEPFDIVISDMRMPGMDGAQFLHEVHRCYPQVVRFILSGQSEEEAAMRAVPVAHQFLSKPCQPELLQALVNQTISLRERVESPEVRSLVGGMSQLPAVPQVLQRLLTLLEDPDSSVKKIAAVIQEDPAIAAKLMQLANSSFFSRGGMVTDLSAATSRLGLRLLRQLTISISIFGTLKVDRQVLDVEALQQEAVHRAALVGKLLQTNRSKEIATLSALLCDVGKLVLAQSAPPQMGQVRRLIEAGALECVAELQIFGCTHAEVGAYLLALWNLPPAVLEVVACHHSLPVAATTELAEVMAALHLADYLTTKTSMNEAWLNTTGLAGTVQRWRGQLGA